MSAILSRREEVVKAIKGERNSYLPLLYFNGERKDSDIILIDVVRHFSGENNDKSEWGIIWSRCDDTMGQPSCPVFVDSLQDIVTPNPNECARFAGCGEVISEFGDRFYIASLVLSGFAIMSILRGFDNALCDLYTNPSIAEGLADIVFTFEEQIIEQLAGLGFHGVAFYDDWGTQDGMIISPEKWRIFFKPRYLRQFDLAHSHGLQVYFHSCGNVEAIIGDLIEIGVDMLNLSQPNILDIERIGMKYAGKTCFVCPVSYQTTSIFGTRAEIFAEANRLVEHLGSDRSGFIGYLEEYPSIKMPPENYRACINAFKDIYTT